MKLSSRVTQYRAACGNDNVKRKLNWRTTDAQNYNDKRGHTFYITPVYDCSGLTLWYFASVGLYCDVIPWNVACVCERKKKERNANEGGRKLARVRTIAYVRFDFPTIRITGNKKKHYPFGLALAKNPHREIERLIYYFCNCCSAYINFVYEFLAILSLFLRFTNHCNTTIPCIPWCIPLLYAFYYISLSVVCFSLQSLCYQSFRMLLRCTESCTFNFTHKNGKKIKLNICLIWKCHKFLQTFVI